MLVFVYDMLVDELKYHQYVILLSHIIFGIHVKLHALNHFHVPIAKDNISMHKMNADD